MLVGVVSDTHGYVDPRLLTAFSSVDTILHAGDIGSLTVLEKLSRLAPVFAVRGNNDVGIDGLDLPERLDFELGGLHFHLVHQLADARPAPENEVIVFGHSHRQLAEWREGVLYLNPGAAGRAGFHRLQTAALLHLDSDTPSVELLDLGAREQLPSRRSIKKIATL